MGRFIFGFVLAAIITCNCLAGNQGALGSSKNPVNDQLNSIIEIKVATNPEKPMHRFDFDQPAKVLAVTKDSVQFISNIYHPGSLYLKKAKISIEEWKNILDIIDRHHLLTNWIPKINEPCLCEHITLEIKAQYWTVKKSWKSNLVNGEAPGKLMKYLQTLAKEKLNERRPF